MAQTNPDSQKKSRGEELLKKGIDQDGKLRTDPITMEIMRNLVISIAEEMGVVLKRAAHSPNIKERMDASCALFDEQARLIAQADHIPVHLGSMPAAVQSILNHFSPEQFKPGDQYISNDPYDGGTHLPDITVIKPIFQDSVLIGYAVCKAHHSDVGGMSPCSMPALSTDIHQEGLRIQPVHIVKEGSLQKDLVQLILANTRTPDDRLGDLQAQLAANEKGALRLIKLVQKYSLSLFRDFTEDIILYSYRRVLESLRHFRPGLYSAQEYLEWDPITHEKIVLQCQLQVERERIALDFTGTAAQVTSNLNAPVAVTKSAVYYVFRCLTDPEIPPNHGSYVPISITIPRSSLLNPDPGVAVAAGNVETSQRIVDLLFHAFGQALPDRIPAQSQGTMNNITFGGLSPAGSPFTYYETIGGGEGAYPFRHGQDGIQVHMTNTANTPAEVIEEKYPLRVLEYSLRPNSGGKGRFKGGRGIVRTIEALSPDISFQIISERRLISAQGTQGGEPGLCGKNMLLSKGKKRYSLPSKATAKLKSGDIVTILTPGGGGYGKP